MLNLEERQVGQCRPIFFNNGGDQLLAESAASKTLRDQRIVRGSRLRRRLERARSVAGGRDDGVVAMTDGVASVIGVVLLTCRHVGS